MNYINLLKESFQDELTKSFEKTTSDRIPKKLWIDEGKELYNATFKKLLDKHKINMYSTFNEAELLNDLIEY